MADKHAQSEKTEKQHIASPADHGKAADLSDGAWQKMTADQVQQAVHDLPPVHIVKDASTGKETMDVPSVFPTDSGHDAKVANDLKDLPAEQQKHVKEGLSAIENSPPDPEKIQQFWQNATPAERQAFIKALKDTGYDVEQKGPSIEELSRIGGPTHSTLKISKHNSLLPSGILISETRNPSTVQDVSGRYAIVDH